MSSQTRAPSELVQQQMIESFDFDAENGTLIWRARPRSHFNADSGFVIWNTHYPGMQAGSVHPKTGYRVVKFAEKTYPAHHIVWRLYHGVWPDEIDHIDGNRANNRVANLRAVTRLENSHNQGRNSRNTSGHTGVIRSGTKWIAQISVSGRYHHLGSFETIDDAVAARVAANQKYGFHENHGSRLSRKAMETR